MQKGNRNTEEEEEALLALSQVEDLAEKKTKIHSRLLTDAALAEDMETLSMRHQKRKETLCALALGKEPKTKKGQGRAATNGEEEEE